MLLEVARGHLVAWSLPAVGPRGNAQSLGLEAQCLRGLRKMYASRASEGAYLQLSELNRKPRQGPFEQPGTLKPWVRWRGWQFPQMTRTLTILGSQDNRLVTVLLQWVGGRIGRGFRGAWGLPWAQPRLRTPLPCWQDPVSEVKLSK